MVLDGPREYEDGVVRTRHGRPVVLVISRQAGGQDLIMVNNGVRKWFQLTGRYLVRKTRGRRRARRRRGRDGHCVKRASGRWGNGNCKYVS